MQVLLEATKEDLDDNHRVQKKAKTKATSTKSASTKDSAEMNDTKKKKEKEKITSGGAIEEVEQPRGRQEISGIEKLATDALNNILPNERTVNITANKAANEQAKAGQKVRQDKKQIEKSDKNLVAPGRDYSRLLQVKRNNLRKKQPEKQKENVIVDNTDVSPEEVFLHKTYIEALQRMRRENVRKVRDHKQPLSKNSDAALDAVASAKDKKQSKDLAPTAAAIATDEVAKRETIKQQAALAYQLKQLQQLQQIQQLHQQQQLRQQQQIQQQRQQLNSSYLSQIQSQAALLPLLMGGGQGATPGFGGMEVNQIFQNLLGQNNVNMNAANGFQKFNWDSNQGGDIGKSGANLSVPPSENNNRSSSKMMNSSPKRKRAGNSSSMLVPSVDAVALKRNIGFIIDEQVKTIRKKIALKFVHSEAAAEKELNLLENRNALHAALCTLFELPHRE